LRTDVAAGAPSASAVARPAPAPSRTPGAAPGPYGVRDPSRFGLAVKAIRPGKAVAGMTDGGSRQVDSDTPACNIVV